MFPPDQESDLDEVDTDETGDEELEEEEAELEEEEAEQGGEEEEEDASGDAGDGSPGGDASSDDSTADSDAETPGDSELGEDPVYVVTINGEEKQLTEDELIKGYQESAASQERFQEAAQMRKGAQNFWESLGKDPVGALRSYYRHRSGGDHAAAERQLRGVLESHLSQLIEEEQLPEAERTARQYQRRDQEREVELQRLRQYAASQQQRDQLAARANEAWQMLQKSFERHQIDPDSYEGKQVDEALAQILRQGQAVNQDLIDRVSQEAAQRREKHQSEVIEGLSPEELMESHPELVRKIRKSEVKRLKAERTTKAGKATSKGKTTKARRRSKDRPKHFSSAAELSAWNLKNKS